jgi:hypothetical protein
VIGGVAQYALERKAVSFTLFDQNVLIAGSLRMPSVEPPGLAFGVSGHRHDPHGVMGLVIDSAINALKALVGASAFRCTGTAAGSEPPSVGRAGLPAADSKF